MAIAPLAFMAASPVAAGAQQPLSDVLSFLLINRSVVTGDFARDEAAAAATRDTLVKFVLAELNTLPTTSPVSGFSYRLDPELGVSVRSTASFGPFFMERSLTAGKHQASFGIAYSGATFDSIDGRRLDDGTLVATAARFVGDVQPFDAETLDLHIHTRAVTVSGQVGLTDRLDIRAAIPLVTVGFNGRRVDTYRGTAFVQAAAEASSSGLGDVRLGAKYNALRRGGSGVALVGEARLPTGDSDNLLGSGEFQFSPRVVGSFERSDIAVHADVGYAIGGLSDEFQYAGGITVAANERVTVATELIGRTLTSGGRLVDVVGPHPSLIGVETIRLSGTEQATTRIHLAGGLRWNMATNWLLSLNLSTPLTTAGLNTAWMTSFTIDYALGN